MDFKNSQARQRRAFRHLWQIEKLGKICLLFGSVQPISLRTLLQPKTETPSGNLAWPNLWNVLLNWNLLDYSYLAFSLHICLSFSSFSGLHLGIIIPLLLWILIYPYSINTRYHFNRLKKTYLTDKNWTTYRC